MVKNLKLSLLLALLAVVPVAVFCPAVDLELSAQEVVAQEVEAKEADEAALNNQGNLNDVDLSQVSEFDALDPASMENFDPAAMEAFMSSDEGKKFAEEAQKFMEDMQKNDPKQFEEMMAMTQQLMGGQLPEEMNNEFTDSSEEVVPAQAVTA
jgi:hypothetical protein